MVRTIRNKAVFFAEWRDRTVRQRSSFKFKVVSNRGLKLAKISTLTSPITYCSKWRTERVTSPRQTTSNFFCVSLITRVKAMRHCCKASSAFSFRSLFMHRQPLFTQSTLKLLLTQSCLFLLTSVCYCRCWRWVQFRRTDVRPVESASWWRRWWRHDWPSAASTFVGGDERGRSHDDCW